MHNSNTNSLKSNDQFVKAAMTEDLDKENDAIDIEIIRNKIVDYAMVSFATLGFLTVIAVAFNSYKLGFTKLNEFLIQVAVSVILIASSLFRKYLSVNFKIGVLTVILFILCTFNFHGFGIISNMKIFIAVFPVFLSFVLPLRKASIALVVFLILYSVYGYLFTKGISVIAFDINLWSKQGGVWFTGGVVMITASLGLMLVGNFFGNTLKNNFILLTRKNSELIRHKANLETLVKERTEELEALNEDLMSSSEIVLAKNKIINEQNIELRATLENLKATQLQLMQAEKMASLGILTAGVAHEINNPLNFIMGGYVGLDNYFNDSELNKDKKIQFFLSSIITGIHRISNIVDGLNQLNRNNETYTEQCDIHSILNNCFLMLNNQIENRIEVNLENAKQPFIVPGNISKLSQVFLNLLSNSIQAIDKSGTISITTYQKNKSVTIEISDNGSGISKDDLSKITVPFFTTKSPGKGTGLGLSIACNIIKDHNGEINFKSDLGKGTTVTVTLPTY